MQTEKSILHSREQGVRVHVLANLGGLAAIAGLERVDPDLLLGALLEVSERMPRMKSDALDRLRAKGAQALDERGSKKRAWSARKRALDLHNVHLSSDQILTLLSLLGAPVPSDGESLPIALSDALRES